MNSDGIGLNGFTGWEEVKPDRPRLDDHGTMSKARTGDVVRRDELLVLFVYELVTFVFYSASCWDVKYSQGLVLKKKRSVDLVVEVE